MHNDFIGAHRRRNQYAKLNIQKMGGLCIAMQSLSFVTLSHVFTYSVSINLLYNNSLGYGRKKNEQIVDILNIMRNQ